MENKLPKGVVTDLEKRIKEGNITELYACIPDFIDLGDPNPSKITSIRTDSRGTGCIINLSGYTWNARNDGTIPFGEIDGYIFDNYWLAYAHLRMMEMIKDGDDKRMMGDDK